MTGSGVQHQQRFPGGVGALTVDDLAQLAQLVHQVLLIVQPAGGIHQHHIHAPRLGSLQRIKQHRTGIGALVLTHNVHTGALGPDLQLVGGGGAEGIAGAQQHLLALLAELMGHLADGGGLAHAVDADEQHHGGLGADVQRHVVHFQLPGKDPAQGGLALLGALQALVIYHIAQFFYGRHGHFHAHIRHDERFLQFVEKRIVHHLPDHGIVPRLFDLIEQTHRYLLLPSAAAKPRRVCRSDLFYLIFSSFAISLRLMVRILLTPRSCMVTP